MKNDLVLSQLSKRQNLVVTRRQALDCGLHPSTLHRRALTGGRWQEILPGVYLTVTGTPTPDQRDTAAVFYAGRGGTLTGTAALRRHGMRVQPDCINVLIPASRRRQSTAFVVIQRTRRLPSYVCYK